MKRFFISLSLLACSSQEISFDQDVIPIDRPINVEHDSHLSSRSELLKPLIVAIENQKKEFLPFDEPKTEHGQQDGRLRPAWLSAYFSKKRIYYFNNDRYLTFHNGNPFVPQVCADFIVDTIDRSAGTWYSRSLNNPQRIVGVFDFRKKIIDDGFNPRRTHELIEFFKKNHDDFQIIFEGVGPKIGNVKNVKFWMKNLGIDIGDIIFISGKVPWDRKEEHNHSFFVTGLDGSGYPDEVTGNPVFPVTRRFVIESIRTPQRRIKFVVRLNSSFLKSIQ